MSKTVTDEMISAFVDGELSPADNLVVGNAIAADDGLRSIAESYRLMNASLTSVALHTQSTVSLPPDFTSGIMAQVNQIAADVHPIVSSQNGDLDSDSSAGQNAADANGQRIAAANTQSQQRSNKPSPSFVAKRIFTTRTIVEILVATAATVLVIINWPATSDSMGPSTAQGDPVDAVKSKGKSDVHMLSIGDNGKKNSSSTARSGDDSDTTKVPEVSASREFSIFANESARPSIDRFWILNGYEVTAPEQEPDDSVNILLIDSKKLDAVKFFAELKKWDANFKAFQDSGRGHSASWLAPFDVSKVDETEGDFWKLRIVLITK